MLSSFSQAASDQLGRKISGSAVLRAVVRLTDRGVIPFGGIVEEIERELTAGRRWGHDAVKPMP